MGAIKNIHFVGIGGIGMSGIAKILIDLGYTVSGSDLSPNGICSGLEKAGARISNSHVGVNVEGADLIVRSSAIGEENEEIIHAKEIGLPVIQRARMLGMLMNPQVGIAVAGTHGKTSTSAMIATILHRANFDPTFVIGGVLGNFKTNCHLGDGNYFVAEADESDGSLVELNPHFAVITNIEDDHLDYYGNTENLKRTFRHFIEKVDPDGMGIVSADCKTLVELKPGISRPLFTYGIENGADLKAVNICESDFQTCYELMLHGDILGQICLNVPGKFNIMNSLAAAAVGLNLGISFDVIRDGLESFTGVKRRFELVASLPRGIRIYDDYAHHPSEVQATLDSAKASHPGRVVAVFQPHRYTRTQMIGPNFGNAFASADEIIITDIYSAGEDPIDRVDAEIIVNAIKNKSRGNVQYIPKIEDVVIKLEEMVEPNDLLITLGAGDVYRVAYELARKLKQPDVAYHRA